MQVGQMSVCQMPVYQTLHWQNGWPNICRTNVCNPNVIQPKVSWPNVCWSKGLSTSYQPNNALAKCLSVKYPKGLLAKYLSAKYLLAKRLSANSPSAKCLLAECFSTKRWCTELIDNKMRKV
jgi:hypothetical protein